MVTVAQAARQPRATHPQASPTAPSAEPDLVERIFQYLAELYPEIKGDRADSVKAAIRDEFAGEEAYVRRRPAGEREQLASQVLSMFNGRNATEVARRLDISRATVYRLLKQAGPK